MDEIILHQQSSSVFIILLLLGFLSILLFSLLNISSSVLFFSCVSANFQVSAFYLPSNMNPGSAFRKEQTSSGVRFLANFRVFAVSNAWYAILLIVANLWTVTVHPRLVSLYAISEHYNLSTVCM
jgi:hypothetical protein